MSGAASVPPAVPTPLTALVLILTSAAALALGGAFSKALGLGLWSAAPVQLVALLLPPLAWAGPAGLLREAFPFRRMRARSVGGSFLLLAGASAAAIGSALLLGFYLGENPSEEALRAELAGYSPSLRLFLFAAVPALCEEGLFRGAILRCLRPWGRMGACLASGALFAALHLDPVKFLPVGLLGTALALAVWETGSLWPAVVGHGLHNAAVLALAGFSAPAAAPEPFLRVAASAWLLAAGLGVGVSGLYLLSRRAV